VTESEVRLTWDLNLASYQRLHCGFILDRSFRRVGKEVASDEREGETMLRMQFRDLVKDAFELSVDRSNSYSA
jgi:hypothetical protein